MLKQTNLGEEGTIGSSPTRNGEIYVPVVTSLLPKTSETSAGDMEHHIVDDMSDGGLDSQRSDSEETFEKSSLPSGEVLNRFINDVSNDFKPRTISAEELLTSAVPDGGSIVTRSVQDEALVLQEKKRRAIAELTQLHQMLGLGVPSQPSVIENWIPNSSLPGLSSVSSFEPVHLASGTSLVSSENSASQYSPRRFLVETTAVNQNNQTNNQLWGQLRPDMTMQERERRELDAYLRSLRPPTPRPVVEEGPKLLNMVENKKEITVMIKSMDMLFTKKFDYSRVTGEVPRTMHTFNKIRKRIIARNGGGNVSFVKLVIETTFGGIARRKLRTLGRYVAGNTYRKVMISWNFIENRYERTSHYKLVMESDANGLLHPAKHNALKLSALTALLCSYKVKVAYHELKAIYGRLGFVEPEDINHSLRLAALRVLLGPSNGEGKSYAADVRAELLHVLKERDETLVTKEEIAFIVFPDDEVERQKELSALETEREQLAQTLTTEKRKKEMLLEKMEQRRLKTFADFKMVFRTAQTIRGVNHILNPVKHAQFKDLIEFCQQNASKKNVARELLLPPQAVELIGLQHFPVFLRDSIDEVEKAQQQENYQPVKVVTAKRSREGSMLHTNVTGGNATSLSDAGVYGGGEEGGREEGLGDPYHYEGGFRINIQGPPSVAKMMHDVVAMGKGLNGLSHRDAVRLLQMYAATRLTAFFRGFRRRWRYFAARARWMKFDWNTQRKSFKGWAKIVRHDMDTHIYCWRKVKLWHRFTQAAKARREVFRICHWPFYIWRRWSTKSKVAKTKSKFLATKVLPTVTEMHVFRAWRDFVRIKSELMVRAKNHDRVRNYQHMKLSLQWLHIWAKQHAVLKRQWFAAGLSQLKRNLYQRKNFPFQVWRAYAHYKKLVRGRARSVLRKFKGPFAVGLTPLIPWTNSQRRAKKLADARRRRELENQLRREATKKKLRKLRSRSGKTMEEGSDDDDDGDDMDADQSTVGGDSTGMNSDTDSELDGGSEQDDIANAGGGGGGDGGGQKSARSARRDEEKEKNLSSRSKGDKNEEMLSSDTARSSNPRKSVVLASSKSSESFAKLRAKSSIAETLSSIYGGRGWKLLKEGFSWKPNRKHFNIDIDSDDEDVFDIPDDLLNIYDEHIEPLPSAAELPFFSWTDKYTIKKIDIMAFKFSYAEVAALVEYTGRFMNFACRAFRNWRAFTKVRRGSKLANTKISFKIKRYSFDCLLKWIKPADIEGGKIDGKNMTEAEVLANIVRSARLTKMYRRRQAYLEVMALDRDAFTDKGEFDEVAEQQRIKAKYERLKASKSSGAGDKKGPQDSTEKKKAAKKPLKAIAAEVKSGDKKHVEQRPSSPDKNQPVTGRGGKRGSNAHEPGSVSPQPVSRMAGHRGSQSRPGSQGIGSLGAVPKGAASGEDTAGGEKEKATVGMEDEAMGTVEQLDMKSMSVPQPPPPPPTVTDKHTKNVSVDAPLQLTKAAVNVLQTLRSDADAPKPVQVIDRTLASGYKPPDLLLWDRQDREVSLVLAEKMMILGKQMREQAQVSSEQYDLSLSSNEANGRRMETMINEVLVLETHITDAAVEMEFEYVSDFKKHAAEAILEVLTKIYGEVLYALLLLEQRKYFRTLRMSLWMKRGQAMCNRKKMRNWIRICKRLCAFYRHAPAYHKRRAQWLFFNRWLKLVERESLDATPEFVTCIVTRVKNFDAFNEYLDSFRFVKAAYTDMAQVNRFTLAKRALFLRWSMYVFESRLFKSMSELLRKRRRLRLLLKCFLAIKTSMTIREIMDVLDMHPRQSYPLTRVNCDIDQLSKRFVARRKNGLSYMIIKCTRMFTLEIKSKARDTMTFKRFMVMYHAEVKKRIVMEQIILCNAFEIRGKQDFRDLVFPPNTDGRFPTIMSRVDGEKIADPWPFNATFADPMTGQVPAGFKLHKMLLNFQDRVGLVGWQLTWIADGMVDVETSKRGKWHGAGMSVEEIIVPHGDFVMGLEYSYEGISLLSLRLKLLKGGLTKWVGSRSSSMACLTCSLSADMLVPNSEECQPLMPEEETKPAIPRSYIIGFSAAVNTLQVTAMKIIVREVRTQHLFSFHWVNDAIGSTRVEYTAPEAAMPKPSAKKVGRTEYSRVTTISHAAGNVASSLPPLNRSGVDSSVDTGSVISARINAGASVDGDDVNDSDDGFGMEMRDEFSVRGGGDQTTAGAQSSARPVSKTTSMKLVQRKIMHSLQTGTHWIFHLNHQEEKIVLSETEEQFFDVMRMRSTELSHAVKRVEDFARRLWTDKVIRLDPALQKLGNVLVVSSLTKWLFKAVGKGLVGIDAKDPRAKQLLEESKKFRDEAQVLESQLGETNRELIKLETMERPWVGRTLLSPEERRAKNDFIFRNRELQPLKKRLHRDILIAKRRADDFEKRSKFFEPRLPLTNEICTNFHLKIAASRNKSALLQRMSLDDIKRAMAGGGGGKDQFLSAEDLILVTSTLKNQKKDPTPDELLKSIVEDELKKELQRQAHSDAEFEASLRFTLTGKFGNTQRKPITPRFSTHRPPANATATLNMSLISSLSNVSSTSKTKNESQGFPQLKNTEGTMVKNESSSPMVKEGHSRSPKKGSVIQQGGVRVKFKEKQIMSKSAEVSKSLGSLPKMKEQKKKTSSQKIEEGLL